MNDVRRSEWLKAKRERLEVIARVNVLFPTMTQQDSDTKQLKAVFSLPFVTELRQKSCIDELTNTDPGARDCGDSDSEHQRPGVTYHEYDLEYLSDLTELSSSEDDNKHERQSEGKAERVKRQRGKKEENVASSKKSKNSSASKAAAPKVAVISRELNRPDEVFKPHIGADVTGKDRRALRKKLFAEHQRKQKARQNTKVVSASDFDIAVDPRHTSTRWSGVNAKKDFQQQIQREISRGRSDTILNELMKIPYTLHERTCVTDLHGRMFLYRSSLNNYLLSDLLPAINQSALDFVKAVKHPFSKQDRLKNARGRHWFSIAGHDRNNKETPSLSVWHKENIDTLEKFFCPGSPFCILTTFGCRILSDNFPAIALRYQESANYMKRVYNIEPMFGLFWNWCLNTPREEVDRVFCLPHVDSKNIALGVCMVFVYGHFNHHERCWLVIWEAGIVLELPPGVFLLYPSSLFIHFNIDLCDLPVVVTQNGEQPTRHNTKPLYCKCESHKGDSKWHKAQGRGSIVWFNQATMFQTTELGASTVAKAKDMGMDTRCDTERWIRKEPVFPEIPTK